MEYVIGVYDSEGQKYKIYGKRKQMDTAVKLYQKTIDRNTVYFERNTLNRCNKHKELRFYLYLLKEKTEGDEETVVRDSMGRLIKEKFKDEKYTIVDKVEFKIEETFLVFGFKGRLTFKDIVKKLLMNSTRTKYIFYLLNKLVIEDYDDIQIVICKNKKQSRLLHDKLLQFFKYNGIKRGIFMNELNKNNRKRIYDEIKNKTGWKPSRIYRNSTRP
jgi:hypothetical protein